MTMPIEEDVTRAYIDGRNDARREERARIRRELLDRIAQWRSGVGLHEGRTQPLTERELGANAACAAILPSSSRRRAEPCCL